MQSCRIMSSSPTVMAEMVFAEKYNAETVISMFNNKKVCAQNYCSLKVLLTSHLGRRTSTTSLHEARTSLGDITTTCA